MCAKQTRKYHYANGFVRALPFITIVLGLSPSKGLKPGRGAGLLFFQSSITASDPFCLAAKGLNPGLGVGMIFSSSFFGK